MLNIWTALKSKSEAGNGEHSRDAANWESPKQVYYLYQVNMIKAGLKHKTRAGTR